MPTFNTVKETPVQFAERKLAAVHKLLGSFGRMMTEEAKSSYEERFNALSEEFVQAPEKVSNQAVVALFNEVATSVTELRIVQIRSLVERSVAGWAGSRYCEPFAATSAASQATEWLKGAPNGDPKTVKIWLDAGWAILKGALDAPWGNCSCGGKKMPVLVNDQKTGTKVWRVFATCQNCYWQKKNAEEARLAATQGKPRVSKPGSAARRTHAPKPPKATSAENGKNDGNSRRDRPKKKK